MESIFQFPLEQSLGLALWKVSTLWQRKIKFALEEIDLTHSQFVILATLTWHQEHKKEVTQTTIIEESKLDKMIVSHSLKTLEARGFVRRTASKQDSRAKNIALSSQGLRTTQQAIQKVEEVDIHFFSQLGSEEKQHFLKIFHTLREEK